MAKFSDFLGKNGFNINAPVFDGNIHRFDRKGKKNAWYIGWTTNKFKGDGQFITAVVGDWKTGEKFEFKNLNGGLSKDEKKIYDDKLKEAVKKADAERVKLQDEAARRAKQVYESGSKKVTQIPYLEKKRLQQLFGATSQLEESGRTLYVPMYNIDGEIKGVQRIYEDGTKRFITGQQNHGNFALIGTIQENDMAFICEGWATGATIHMATGKTVFCAMSANNLLNVAKAVKMRYPSINIGVAGDSDEAGRKSANEAATAIMGVALFPSCKTGTDFNDLYIESGIEVVKKRLTPEIKLDDGSCSDKNENKADVFNYLRARGYVTENGLCIRNYNDEFYIYKHGCYQQIRDSEVSADVSKWFLESSLEDAGSKKRNDLVADLKGAALVSSEIKLNSWISIDSKKCGRFLAVKNGIIEFDKLIAGNGDALLTHSPDFFSTVVLPFDYDPPASCDIWTKFLCEVQPDEEIRNLIQEMFGYCLTYSTKHQKFFLMVGSGANGKSVVCLVLKLLLGVENVSSVSIEQFDPKRTFLVAEMNGKLANIVPDMSPVNRSSRGAIEGLLKKLVSGDSIMVERKHKHPFDMIPTAKCVFAANQFPEFLDSSDGILRRMIAMPFEIKIEEENQDRSLATPEFWLQGCKLSGVLNWAIEGLIRLEKRGRFEIPKKCSDVRSHNMHIYDPAQYFLRNNYCAIEGAFISSNLIYKEYCEFCHDDHEEINRNHFARKIKEIFPSVYLTNNALRKNKARSRNWINISKFSHFKDVGTTGTVNSEFNSDGENQSCASGGDK